VRTRGPPSLASSANAAAANIVNVDKIRAVLRPNTVRPFYRV
jgi:hypothetical protein